MVFPDFNYSPEPSRASLHYSHHAQTGPKTHIVPAAHGFAFEVKKGEHFRVVDLYGEQVVVGSTARALPPPLCIDEVLRRTSPPGCRVQT